MRDRAARHALADDRGDQRHAERKAFLGRAGDRLGLAALLGLDAGKGAGRVDQGDHRQAETVGQVHQPDRLAIAFGPGHAEIVLEAAGGVVAFLLADHARSCGRPIRPRPPIIALSSAKLRSPASGTKSSTRAAT